MCLVFIKQAVKHRGPSLHHNCTSFGARPKINNFQLELNSNSDLLQCRTSPQMMGNYFMIFFFSLPSNLESRGIEAAAKKPNNNIRKSIACAPWLTTCNFPPKKKNEQRDLKTIEKSFHFLREKRKKKNDGKGSKKPHQTHENFMVLGINCRAGVVKEMIVVAFRMIETQQTRNETALRSYHQTVRNAPI